MKKFSKKINENIFYLLNLIEKYFYYYNNMDDNDNINYY